MAWHGNVFSCSAAGAVTAMSLRRRRGIGGRWHTRWSCDVHQARKQKKGFGRASPVCVV